MPEPPATPAVRAREAEQEAMDALGDAVYERERAQGEFLPLGEWANARAHYRAALAAYRDAVAARVTAELLASGTPLWVATETDWGGSRLYASDPNEFSTKRMVLQLSAALTPPGTVHQAVLLMKPEEQA